MTATILKGTFSRIKSHAAHRGALSGEVFGKKLGVAASLFGCWHEDLRRPFGRGEATYRSCLKCGARTPFNVETLRTEGKFYQAPVS